MADPILIKDSAQPDCISNNIPSRAFRYAAENKTILSKQGAIYVGTGEPRTTTMMLDDGTTSVEYTTYKTGVLLPPTANGTYTLKCVVNNGVVTVGWVADTGTASPTFASQAGPVSNS